MSHPSQPIPSLPGYRDLKPIRASETCLVCRATREEDGLPVIIKAMSAAASADPMRLKREHDIMRDLNVPSVPRAYAFVSTGSQVTLVMEDLDGVALDQLLGAPMELRKFLGIAPSIAAALAQVHARSVVHKDIKPANIIVNPETGDVKLTDFGVAAKLPFGHQAVDTRGLIEGTLAYISPEQTGRMNRGIDYRSDLYSLGVTYYRMLTGRLPFESDDGLELIYSHIARFPPSPSELLPTIPAVLSDIVLKLLSKSAEDRYQSARGLEGSRPT